MKELYLHPIFIHFPIAFYFLELILLILWKLKTPHVIASPPKSPGGARATWRSRRVSPPQSSAGAAISDSEIASSPSAPRPPAALGEPRQNSWREDACLPARQGSVQSIVADKDILDYRRFALFSFKLGYLFMIVAMVTGLRDAGGFSKITGLVRPHFFGALIIFALYTLRAFGWRIFSQAQKGYAWIQIGGAVLGYAAVIFTAFFGGRLVYG